MLRINALKKIADVKYIDLSFGLNDRIVKTNDGNLKLSNGRLVRIGDVIRFESILSGMLFTDERVVNNVDDEYFYIDSFNDIRSNFFISNIDSENSIVYFQSTSIESLIRLDNDTPIGGNCVGTYKSDGIFIRKVEGVDNNGNIILSEWNYNKKSDIYFVYNDKRYTLTNCITPCNSDCSDNPRGLVWISDNTEIFDILRGEYAQDIVFYYEDNRFFTTNDGINYSVHFSEYSTTVNTTLKKVTKWINVSFGINESPMYDLYQEEALKKYVKREKDNAISDIVDYEKTMFEPVYTTDGRTYRSVSKIEFNLHMRDRSDNYEDWTTSDEKYWNQYRVEKMFAGLRYNASTSMPNGQNIEEYAKNIRDKVSIPDHIYYLGFDKNDVFKSKNRLKKSFIRLSVYDTTDRNTQSLLYYSTIFFRYGDMYRKYINGEFIGAQFFAENKHSLKNSSDGFYMYLFNNVIGKEGQTPLYLKIEFNHAKYGKTIPMMLPVGENGPLQPNDFNFPTSFTVGSINGNNENITSSSSKDLYKSLYIKFYVKYLQDEKRFVWFFPWGDSEYNGKFDNKLVLNLFEPRINGWMHERMKSPINDDGEDDEGKINTDIDIIDRFTIYPDDFWFIIDGAKTLNSEHTLSKGLKHILSYRKSPDNAPDIFFSSSFNKDYGWKIEKYCDAFDVSVIKNGNTSLIVKSSTTISPDEYVEISLSTVNKNGTMLTKKVKLKFE